MLDFLHVGMRTSLPNTALNSPILPAFLAPVAHPTVNHSR